MCEVLKCKAESEIGVFNDGKFYWLCYKHYDLYTDEKPLKLKSGKILKHK